MTDEKTIVEVRIIGTGVVERIPYHEALEVILEEDTGSYLDGAVDTYDSILCHKKLGSDIQLLVHWDTGYNTWESINLFKKHDPIVAARYAEDNNLMEKIGWKWAKKYKKCLKKPNIFCNNVKQLIRSNKPIKYKFGVRVPRNTTEAYLLDKENGNGLWAEAIQQEFDLLQRFGVLQILGPGESPPLGYKWIPYHSVFDVKYDLRHRCRTVAGGNMNEMPDIDTYCPVINVTTVRMALMYGAANDMLVCAADISSAYLHSDTKEKVFVRLGKEFGEYEGTNSASEESVVWNKDRRSKVP